MNASSEDLGANLLARVRASPRDLDARAVYADWLLEHDDVLGELIVLQLAESRGAAKPKDLTRIRELLRLHRDHWLGPLARVLRKVRFEAGFPSYAELEQNHVASRDEWAQASRAPQLATVRELRQGLGNQAHYLELVTSPAMRGLELIEVPQPSFLEELASSQIPASVRALELLKRPTDSVLSRLSASSALKQIASLGCALDRSGVQNLVDDLNRVGLLSRLEALHVWPLTSEDALSAWSKLPANISSFSWNLATNRTERCAIVRHQEGLRASARCGADGAVALMRALPAPISALDLELVPARKPSRKLFDRALADDTHRISAVAANRGLRVVISTSS